MKNLKTYILSILLASLAFFTDFKMLFVLIFVLTNIDLVTGIMKYFKVNNVIGIVNKFRSIKSALLKRTITKEFVYILFFMCCCMVEKILFKNDGYYFSKFVAGSIAVVELRSIAENMDFITGETIFSKITKKLTEKLNSVLEKKEDK
jgi:hypothetical protein